MKRGILAFAVAVLALAVEGPMNIGAYLMSHGEGAPDGFFFRWVPGVGLAVVGLLGNALVAQAVTRPETPKGIRVLLGICWGLAFLSILVVLPIYLLGAQESTGTESMKVRETIALAMTPAGALAWFWCLAVVLTVHVTVPALMIVSAVQQHAAGEDKKKALEHDRLVIVDHALDTAKGSTQTRIIALISEHRSMSVAALHRHMPDIKTSQTVRSNAETLKEKGQLRYVLGRDPREYELAQHEFS